MRAMERQATIACGRHRADKAAKADSESQIYDAAYGCQHRRDVPAMKAYMGRP